MPREYRSASVASSRPILRDARKRAPRDEVEQVARWLILMVRRREAPSRTMRPVKQAFGSTGYDPGPRAPPSHSTEYFTACQGPPDRPRNWSGIRKETSAENELTIKGKAYIA